MSQPMNSIDEIITAAKQDLDPVEGKSAAEVRAEHFETLLERALELLLACAAVQGELEKRVESVIEANRDLFGVVLGHSAENAVLKRRLEVACDPQVVVQIDYVYKGRKVPDTKHLLSVKPSPSRRRKAATKVRSKQARKD